MKHRFIILLLSAVCCLPSLFTGCGETTPKDLPKLFPVKLTFTQDGKPLTGAMVSLQSKDESVQYGSGGLTDAGGTVILQTHGKYAGVPKGTYTISLSKTESVRTGPWDQIPKEEAAGLTFIEQNRSKLKQEEFHVIPPKYRTADTSDFTLSVEGKTDKTFDVPAFREKVSESELRGN